MNTPEPKNNKTRWAFALLFAFLAWGFYTGRLNWQPNIALASFRMPLGGPTAEVHPEVLNLQASFSRVAELVKPAVVSISTVHIQKAPMGGPEFYFGDPFEEFFQQFFNGPGDGHPQRAPRSGRPRPQEFKSEGVGSGVIIDAEGLVLTNEHVVRGADQIKITVYEKAGEKKEYTGTIVGKDARTDLAVVRIKAGHKLPFAALGDSDKVRIGDWAIAIGSPFNLAQTVTVGIISADRQSLPIEGREYRNLIQTDASINRGNSGGPLLNIRGEVMGINTAIFAPTGVFAGIGFAVPINQAKAILEDLIHKGHVVRGWLGVELAREITPAMVNTFGLSDDKGALVNDVMKNSPADKAGLMRGDVVLSFNGKRIESSDNLQALVSQTPPKKSVPVELMRAKSKMTVNLVLGERPESADTGEKGLRETPDKKSAKPDQKEWLGAKVTPITRELTELYQQPRDLEGVLVIDVGPGTEADDLGLAQGDVIRAVNGVTVADLSAFKKAIEGASTKKGIVLDIVRQGHPLYLSLTKN